MRKRGKRDKMTYVARTVSVFILPPGLYPNTMAGTGELGACGEKEKQNTKVKQARKVKG
jgi:hypothetical protein